jgi:hypothetical protein
MQNEQLLRQITEWQSRLTGLPESCFEGLDLDRKLTEIARWHASKVVAEQMVVLLVAQAMLEDGMTAKDLATHLGSRESKATPLGRFNFVTGIAEWPGMVARVFLPLLRMGGYRPFLRYDTAKAVLDLCALFTVSDRSLRPGDVADTLYRRGLSPHVAKRTLQTLRAFGESAPRALPRLRQASAAVREQAVQTIADLPEIGECIEGLEAVTSPDAAGAEGGC